MRTMRFQLALFALLGALFLAGGCATPSAPLPAEQPVSQQTPKSEAAERARVHVELGRMYLAEGRFDVALEEAKLAAEIDPGYAPAFDLMGLITMALRQNDAAGAAFRQALRLAPQDPEINNDYGWFLCQNREPREGLRHLERALANPFYQAPARALTNAGLCALLVKDDALAEGYFRQALQIERTNVTAHFWLADIAYRGGRYNEARRHLDELHALVEPTAASAWLALRVERRLGEREREARYANVLAKKYPDSPEREKLARGEYD